MSAGTLFLAHRIPFPPDKGDKIRSWHMLRHLAQRGPVYLGCFYDDPADAQHIPFLRTVCADVLALPISPLVQKIRALPALLGQGSLSCAYYRDARLARWVDMVLDAGNADLAFVFSTAMAPYVIEADQLPRMLDMVDVDSAKWSALGAQRRGPMGALLRREAQALARFERRCAERFDHTLLVSPDEVACFADIAGPLAARVTPLSNGVDTDYFAPAADRVSPFADARPRIVFTGAMDYEPNVDAVTWLVREVLPLVEPARRPALAIVGSRPSRAVQALRSDDVQVTGRVDDVRPYLQFAQGVVAPMRIARGIQNKVLEGMAMARPVLVTKAALEGLEAQPGRDVLLADEASELAARIAELAGGAHQELGPVARGHVLARYGWSQRLSLLDELLRKPALQGAA